MIAWTEWEEWSQDLADQDWEAWNQRAWEEGFSDGLPLAVPTASRVTHLMGTHPPDRVLGQVPVRRQPVTVRDAAVQGAMAGLRPCAFDVVLAALNGMMDPSFNLLGIATTTGSAAPAVLVSGPAIQTAVVNGLSNALGPGPWSNAAIGRTLHLILQNVGGCRPGIIDMATLGQPGKYTFCFAENISESPWPLFSESRGFGPEDSVVTVMGVAGSIEVVDQTNTTPEDLMATYALGLRAAGSLSSGGMTLGSGQAVVLLPPESALVLHQAGWGRQDAQQYLYEHAILPVSDLSPGHQRLFKEACQHQGLAIPDMIRSARSPNDVFIIVTGGTGVKGAILPTWGAPTHIVSRLVTGSG